MSKAIPSKPPRQTSRQGYVVTTTSRVPGRGSASPSGPAPAPSATATQDDAEA